MLAVNDIALAAPIINKVASRHCMSEYCALNTMGHMKQGLLCLKWIIIASKHSLQVYFYASRVFYLGTVQAHMCRHLYPALLKKPHYVHAQYYLWLTEI